MNKFLAALFLSALGACLPLFASAQSVTPPPQPILCPLGSHADSATRTCVPDSTTSQPKQPPTCGLSAASASGGVGQTVNLSWSSTNATGGTITTIGSVGPSGIQGVIPLAPASTYTGTFSGPGGVATCQISIPVAIGGGAPINDGSPTGSSNPTSASDINTGDFGATAPPAVNIPTNSSSGVSGTNSGGNLDTSNGLVTCANNPSASCNLCTFGSTFQKILNFAVGVSIPLAAVAFAFAGWLYFSNRENPTQIERAHKIFWSVLVGFCLVLMSWLMIQTILKALAPGYQSWNSWTCTGTRVTTGTIDQVLQGTLGTPNQAPLGVVNIPAQYQAVNNGLIYDDRTGCANGSTWNANLSGCVNSDGDISQPVGFTGGLTAYREPSSYGTCDGTDKLGSDGLCHGFGLGDEAQNYAPYAMSSSRSGPEGLCPSGYRYTEDSDWAWCQGPQGSNDVEDFIKSNAGQPIECTSNCGNIAAAALAYRGTDTSAGPDGGNKACAWAVNNVLASAGVAPIDGASVENMETALSSGRGSLVGTDQNTSNTQPGDIVIWKSSTFSHVGICVDSGCSQVISNSSGNASFTNVTPVNFNGSWNARIYHVNQ
jgi:hypothetical protein